MDRCLKITTLISVFTFLLAFDSLSFAGTYVWEFNDRRELSGWETLNVDSAYIDRYHLVVKGEAGLLRIISPRGLDIPSSWNALWLRVKSEKQGSGKILFGFLRDGKRQGLEKKFWIYGGRIYRDYKIYTGDIVPSDFRMDRFAIYFPDEEVEAEIDFIRFYEPTFFQLFHLLWSQFWEPDRIKGSTINFVTAPKIGSFSFMTVLYGVVIILSILSVGIVLYLFALKAVTLESVIRAITISFLVGGGLFAVRMDYNWIKIWQYDFTAFEGKDVHERIPVVFKGFFNFFDFIDFVKATVPEDEKTRSATRPNLDIYEIMARYHLLPVETSAEGDYLWAYNTRGVMDVYFDTVTRSLMEGDRMVASPVRPVAAFGDVGALYKIEKEEK
jgi:hypothetical protein